MGHGDIFIHSWLEVISQSALSVDSGDLGHKTKPQWMTDIFEELANAKGPGVCTKCHSIDQSDNTGVLVNWRGAQPLPSEHTFTTYSHESHFSLLDEKGCVTCHTINAEAKFSAGFDDRDPTTFASNFNPLEQAVCAGCHQAKKASDGCLTCHNYHVGDFLPAVPTTKEVLTVSGE